MPDSAQNRRFRAWFGFKFEGKLKMLSYSIQSYPTFYKGFRYRSRLEAKWAAFFDIMGWKFEYEPIDFGPWSPDFAIITHSGPLYVEVKPILECDKDVARRMAEVAGEHLLVGLAPRITEGETVHGGVHVGWLVEGQQTEDAEVCMVSLPSQVSPGWGLISIDGHWRDRISGVYDGKNHLQGGYCIGSAFWKIACNTVQYQKARKEKVL